VCTSYLNSVCLSVHPSVTTRYRFKPRWDRGSGFSLYDIVESLVFVTKIHAAGWGNSPRTRASKRVHPKKCYFIVINSSSIRTVEDRHRLATYHNRNCWRAFKGYQHWWPQMTVNPQNTSFQWIFLDFRLQHTFQEWTAPKSDQDNLRKKCSALNIDFNCESFDPLGPIMLHMRSSNLASNTAFKIHDFCYCRLL